MDRRSLLKGALGAAGALVGAVALGTGVDARETMPEGVPGQQVDATTSMMTLATQGTSHYAAPVDGSRTLVAGPFPDTNVTLERAWRIVNDPMYSGYDPRAGEPDSAFPEYDARYVIHRSIGLGGYYNYDVVDHVTIVGTVYSDPSLHYADGSVASQELASRALYVEHLAHLRGGNMALVTGPDPDTYVYVEWGPTGAVHVIPPGTASPNENVNVRGMGVPRAEFPEFDAKHGIVTIFHPASNLLPPDEWTVPLIRAHYLYALGQRAPYRPLDGNHLAYRFIPPYVDNHLAGVLLNGYNVFHVDESYDGANGWVVQFELGENGQPITHDNGERIILRRRILMGDVQHWMDGATFHPGDYTAPLLR